MAGRIFATDLPFSEPWRDCEDTRCRRHQGELFATADERAASQTCVGYRVKTKTLSQCRTNIFALLGDSSFFDDGKMRNGAGI